MSLDIPDPAELIHGLGWRPDFILKNVIYIGDTIPSTAVRRTPEHSSLGSLDALPLELLHSILNLLDCQSLSRTTRVSHKGKEAVESLPAYRDLTKHASEALIALSRTRLIAFHSAATLYSELQSDECVYCERFGAFLFLPTCERCCYECLYRVQTLRVVSRQQARSCFGLSAEDLRRIPTLVSIPGAYSVGHSATHRKAALRLVSVKHSLELGIAVHGSIQLRDSFVRAKYAWEWTRLELRDFDWLTSRPTVNYLETDPPDDSFCGMASVSFPCLRSNGRLDNGLWCYGCNHLSRHWSLIKNLDHDTIRSFEGIDPTTALMVLGCRAMSESQFIDHVRHCEGPRLVPQKQVTA